MLNSAAIARPLRVSEMYRNPCRADDAEPKVVQLLDRVRDHNANPTSALNRYIEGWAQTDLEKILDATAPSYRFTDPVVGSFDGRSLHKYFDLLQDRLCCTGAISRRQLTSAGSLDIAKWSFNCMAWTTEAVLDDSYKLPEVRKLP